MDYIQNEQKLIQVQLALTREKKVAESLSKLDVISHKIESLLPEKVSCTMKTEESLSIADKIQIPFFVKGRMLGIGKHKNRYYTETELIKASERYTNKYFPIKLDHRKNEASSTIGRVDRIYWHPVEKAILYEGHINDETHARNIADGVAKEVSATILAEESYDAFLGIIGKELEFPELSIVEEGAYKGNTIAPV